MPTFSKCALLMAYGALALLASCFDSSVRWIAPPAEPAEPPFCKIGDQRCTAAIERCVEGAEGAEWQVEFAPVRVIIKESTLLRVIQEALSTAEDGANCSCRSAGVLLYHKLEKSLEVVGRFREPNELHSDAALASAIVASSSSLTAISS